MHSGPEYFPQTGQDLCPPHSELPESPLDTCAWRAPQREAQASQNPCPSPAASGLAPSQSYSGRPHFGKRLLDQPTNAWVCFPDFFEPIFIRA